MSLAVPSGSTLAVLLGATLYPALVGAGMTPVDCGRYPWPMSATIMPSPLAADSIEAAHHLNMTVGICVWQQRQDIHPNHHCDGDCAHHLAALAR